MAPRLYRLLRPLARLILRLFYRRIEVRGREHVPAEGPILLAANHPNMLMDPVLLITEQPRPLSFLAKATLFKSPLLGRFLAGCGVLPVYRRRDDPGETGKNELTFESCFRRLERGGAVALFPEGVTHAREAVLDLKTGCARIALEAEERNGFRLGVRIVPAGLYFSDRPTFRSEVLLVFGPPLAASSCRETYRRDPAAAVRALTADLAARLRELTLHVPDVEDEKILHWLRQIVSTAEPGMRGRLELDRNLIQAVEHFRRTDPARHRELRRQILGYGRMLAVLGVTHSQIDRRYAWMPVARYAAPKLLLAVLGFPLFLWGAVHNFLPYKAPAWLARIAATETVEVATIKLVGGMASFPLLYLAQTVLVAQWTGAGPAAVYFLLLPTTGLFSLFYLESLSDFFREVRVFLLHVFRRNVLETLHRSRENIVREIERCREEYLENLRGGPGESSEQAGSR